MITVTVDDNNLAKKIAVFGDAGKRACEIALDATAFDIRKAEMEEMKRVFDDPTPYTINSLKVTKTRNHNMKARVWFKEPDRMEDHYLLPQVEGGKRKTKGFERALDDTKFVPGSGVRLNKYGNISVGQIRQVLSVLGRAELTAGYQANLTTKSASRNRKDRNYVELPNGSAGGKLPPGIYQRVAKKGTGFGGKAKKTLGSFGTYQKGATRGRMFSVVRARGLKPILIKGKQHTRYKPLLKFYEVADRTYRKRFPRNFMHAMNKSVYKLRRST